MKPLIHGVPTAGASSRISIPLSAGTSSDRTGFLAHLSGRLSAGRSLVVASIIAAPLMSGCSEAPAKDPRLQNQGVETSIVKTSDSNRRSFTGVVEAKVESDLGFRVGGKILERSVEMGQRVRKGQVLMRLDPVDLELAHAAQKAAVESAKAKHELAKSDEARFSRLVSTGAVSRQAHDQVRTELESSEAMLRAAEAQANVTNNFSEYAVLHADADGVIVETSGEPGQVVAAGQTVLKLAQDGAREALVNLPEGVRPNLGAKAKVSLYGSKQPSGATLRLLSDAADPASRTFEARFVLEEEAANAPLGSTATIELDTDQPDEQKNVLVPVGAIHDNGKGPGVWVVDKAATVSLRPVTIAVIRNEEAVLSSGVVVGDEVVALGAHLLHEGQTVKPITGGKHADE